MDTGETCRFVRARVGDNVGALCRDKGLSQSRLAAMVGIDRSHLNQLIGGKSYPVTVRVKPANMEVSMDGPIDAWEEADEILTEGQGTLDQGVCVHGILLMIRSAWL